MLTLILSTSLLATTSTLFMSQSPISMGLLILMMALMATITISFQISSWMCFLVFLIYVSGTLVLFSYFLAVGPNIYMPSIYINVSIIFIFSSMFILMVLLMPMSSMPSFSKSGIDYMYTNYISPCLILLAGILLITMIIVVKLVQSKGGPLRPFAYV